MTAAPAAAPRRRRICLAINDLSRAGAETQLVEHALTLDPQRYDVHVLVLKQANAFPALAERGIPVTRLHRQGATDVLVLWRLYKYLRALRPDVLHSSLLLSNLFCAVAGRLARVPVILLAQHSSYLATEGRLGRALARFSHRLATRVLAVSRAVLEEARAAGLPVERGLYVPNAVPEQAVSEAPPSPSDPGAADDGPVVMTLGQLAPIKGQRYLVEAWPLVLARVPSARLWLVGEGPERGPLTELASRLGVLESVSFLGFREPVMPLLASCAVFVQPSLSEGTPVAVLEAMAAGCAIVATAVGGVGDVVIDRETGLLVPARDPAALAAAIAELLAAPALRASLGSAARARARRDHSRVGVTARLAALYEELLASSSA